MAEVPNREPTNDLWEAMSTMRAMRRLKPDPVPEFERREEGK